MGSSRGRQWGGRGACLESRFFDLTGGRCPESIKAEQANRGRRLDIPGRHPHTRQTMKALPQFAKRPSRVYRQPEQFGAASQPSVYLTARYRLTEPLLLVCQKPGATLES